MRAKVIMPFKDKVTNAVRNTNEVFECDEKRFSEIRKAGNFVVKTDEPVTKPEAKPEKWRRRLNNE